MLMRDKKFILGLHLDNFTENETIEAILYYIRGFQKHPKPSYISTINTDFIVNCNYWNWSDMRNPELVQILRKSVIATCDSTPLKWLSSLLGSPIQERVAGSSLIMPLTAALAEHGYSVYLLGGSPSDAREAARVMQQANPSLIIAGIDNPFIDISGVNLEEAPERDQLIIEQINTAAPSVLLINLGNPKQELWFKRIVDKLNVPISIGIGGTFSLISGSLPRAPEWMQKSGLEWLFRLLQEPKRLWKRYLLGIPQAIYMAVPLVVYNSICRLMYKAFGSNSTGLKSLLFLSSTRTISVLKLPSLLNLSSVELQSEVVQQALSHDHIVIDFKDVRHITPEGMSFLVDLWRLAEKKEKELSGLALSGDMRLLLKMNRAWDVLKAHQHYTVKDLTTTLQQARYNSLYDTIQQDNQSVYLSFFGTLDNKQDYERLEQRLLPIIKDRHFILDFTYCTAIESRGLSFLLALRKHQGQQKKLFQLTNLNTDVREDLKRADLLHHFRVK